MKKFYIIFSVIIFMVFSNSFSQTPHPGSVTAGVNFPAGDFGKVYKSGISAEAGLYYYIPMTNLDVSFTLGYNGFTYKNDYFTGLVKSNLGVDVSGFNADWTASDIPIMLGLKYKFPVGGFNPYISGELGLHLMSYNDRFIEGTTITGNSTDPTTFQLTGKTEKSSETGFGYAFGAGVEIPLIKIINLVIGAKYYYNGTTYSKSYTIFRNNNSQFTAPELKNVSFVTLRGGILVIF
jgi:opacity protein-like surface antigen